MNVSDYEKLVKTKSRIKPDKSCYSFIGLGGEAGEVLEWYKKVVLRKSATKLTLTDLKKELGDVLYYVTRIAVAYGWSIDDLIKANVTKLRRRKRFKKGK